MVFHSPSCKPRTSSKWVTRRRRKSLDCAASPKRNWWFERLANKRSQLCRQTRICWWPKVCRVAKSRTKTFRLMIIDGRKCFFCQTHFFPCLGCRLSLEYAHRVEEERDGERIKCNLFWWRKNTRLNNQLQMNTPSISHLWMPLLTMIECQSEATCGTENYSKVLGNYIFYSNFSW